MDFEIDWTISIPTIIGIGSFIFAWIRTRRENVDEGMSALGREIEHMGERMDRHERRIATLEQSFSVQPGKDDLHQIQLEIAKMGGQLGQVQAVMEGNAKIMERLEKIVGRHEDHLLSGGKQ